MGDPAKNQISAAVRVVDFMHYDIPFDTLPARWKPRRFRTSDGVQDKFIYFFRRRGADDRPEPQPPGVVAQQAQPGSDGGPEWDVWFVLQAKENGQLRGVAGDRVVDAADQAHFSRSHDHDLTFDVSGFGDGGTDGEKLSIPMFVRGQSRQVWAISSHVHLPSVVLSRLRRRKPPMIPYVEDSFIEKTFVFDEGSEPEIALAVVDPLLVADELCASFGRRSDAVAAFVHPEHPANYTKRREAAERRMQLKALWEVYAALERSKGFAFREHLAAKYRQWNEQHFERPHNDRIFDREHAGWRLREWVSTELWRDLELSFSLGLTNGELHPRYGRLLLRIANLVERGTESEATMAYLAGQVKAVSGRSQPFGDAVGNRPVSEFLLRKEPAVGPFIQKHVFRHARTIIKGWAGFVAYVHKANLQRIATANGLHGLAPSATVVPAETLEALLEGLESGVTDPGKASLTGQGAFAMRRALENVLHDGNGGPHGIKTFIEVEKTTSSLTVRSGAGGRAKTIPIEDYRFATRVDDAALAVFPGLSLSTLTDTVEVLNIALATQAFAEAAAKNDVLKTVTTGLSLASALLSFTGAKTADILHRLTGKAFFAGAKGAARVSIVTSILTVGASSISGYDRWAKRDYDAAAAHFAAAGIGAIGAMGTYAFIVGAITAPQLAAIGLVLGIVGAVVSILAEVLTDNELEVLVQFGYFGSRGHERSGVIAKWSDCPGGDLTHWTRNEAGIRRQIRAAQALLLNYAVGATAGGLTVVPGFLSADSAFHFTYRIRYRRRSAGGEIRWQTRFVLFFEKGQPRVRKLSSAEPGTLKVKPARGRLDGKAAFDVLFENDGTTATRDALVARLDSPSRIDAQTFEMLAIETESTLDLNGNGQFVFPRDVAGGKSRMDVDISGLLSEKSLLDLL